MLDFIEQIKNLSDYKFKIGVSNSTSTIDVDDDIVNSADFLKMLEYGSPLHAISATRPIERTWLTMKDEMQRTYSECIDLIMNDTKQILIDERMTMLALQLKLILRQYVTTNIRNDITCYVYYRNKKIN